MSIKTDAIVIRDETTAGANTATRVGRNLVAIADDLVAKQTAIDLNNAKETNIVHPLVETAVPIGAVFTDTDTIYNDADVCLVVEASTAIGFGHQDSQEAIFSHIMKKVNGKVLCFVPFHNVGTNVGLRKIAGALLNQ